MEDTLNLLGIEPWLSVRQADAVTGLPMIITIVSYFLFLCEFINLRLT